jgi:hypothetical protein
MADPFKTYSPAQGIYVDRIERTIRVTGSMDLYGSGASAQAATDIQTAINRDWSKTFSDGWSITCAVSVTHRPAGPTSTAFPVEFKALKDAKDPSTVTWNIWGTPTVMTLNTLDSEAITWVVSHEFGHVLKLEDRYHDFKEHGERKSTANAGWEGNMMAERTHNAARTEIQSKNLADLTGKESTPSFFGSDDEAVRWIKGHTEADIALLSTASKLKTLKNLSEGWISDDDTDAMVKLLRSVKTGQEAFAIRNAFDIKVMNTKRQRDRVQFAFDLMPM